MSARLPDQGRVLLVEGEPGTGKSLLLARAGTICRLPRITAGRRAVAHGHLPAAAAGLSQHQRDQPALTSTSAWARARVLNSQTAGPPSKAKCGKDDTSFPQATQSRSRKSRPIQVIRHDDCGPSAVVNRVSVPERVTRPASTPGFGAALSIYRDQQCCERG